MIYHIEDPDEVVDIIDPQCNDCCDIPVLNFGDLCTRCYNKAEAPATFPEGSQSAITIPRR